MRFSRSLIPTLKEDPNEARVISHKLMLRAGLIRQLSMGIYTWLPLGLKVLNRVANIVRQEMDGAGAQEVLMPAVQPAELWQESGRWDFYGKELLRFKDRHDRPFCFGPTHEEVITDLVRREIRSYRQLPVNFYQIQTKFRDEIRPRFGVMRGREFIMKDAYSFDVDEAGLDASYQSMFAAYQRIFDRCGLRYRAVEADTGAIGGAHSHEFHVLAESGEDTIASCNRCDYAANLEKATAANRSLPTLPAEALTKVATPDTTTIAEVSQLLQVPANRIAKSMLVENDQGAFLLVLRGDHTLNEVKAKHALAGGEIRLLEGERANRWPVGYLGPVNMDLPIWMDESLRHQESLVCGANEAGYHFTGLNWQRDVAAVRFADLSNVEAGDPCPRCQEGQLALDRGIEVGHVFKLGKKYSQAMGVTVQDKDGGETTVIMGCYGIGVSRIVAAAIEQNHDANGIVWPPGLAPFDVEIVLLNSNEEEAAKLAERYYQELRQKGLEVLLDDRDERPGVKFKDADLLGIPKRVLVGGRSLKEGKVELKSRTGQVELLAVEALVNHL
ncbi:MAG: proline--tRNA ligase [Magnetococcales bacterium]|nr:proline--tRNA ligase [Magnetococcales bacterium]NGZ27097.1 proline--tRNA ligase [Magnetococcales bacterium]